MNAIDMFLTDILNKDAQYIVPIYQRKYSWGKEQCIKMLKDILDVGGEERRPCHFIGSLIYLMKPNQHAAATREYLVVDGQQRLTTISIILLALGNYTREKISEDEKYRSSFTSLEKIQKKYLLNEDNVGDLHYKVRLNDEDFEAWKVLIDGQEEAEGFENSRIFKNYNIIYKALREADVDPQRVFSGIAKLKFVDICLAPEDNAQLIFESVNSTGLPLSTADKIRNFLLMQAGDEQNDLYERYWHPMEVSFGMESGSTWEFTLFFRYYMTVVLGKSVLDEFYDTFKSYYFNNSTISTKELVKEIFQYSKYYREWQSASENGDSIQKALCRVRKTGQLKITPAILKLLADRDKGDISKEDLLEILTIMEAYWMRRQICFLPSNTAGPVCISMLKSLNKDNKVKSFKENIFKLTWAQRMPDDSEIRDTLKTLKIYENDSARTKKILDRLENNGRRELVSTSDYSIEHIMPQTLSDEWRADLGDDADRIYNTYLHTIGNLTLTGYNSEYKNKRFAEKKDCRDGEGRPIGYRHTPIRLSSYLNQVDKWGEEEILARTELLANEIISMWKYPEKDE